MAKKAALPKRLYKYRSMSPEARPFTESIFRKNEVWYAQASTFNDPFDCDHFINIDRTTEEWRTVLEDFEKKFAQMVMLLPGRLLGGLWNKFAENYNEKAKAESKRELPTLSDEKLLALTENIGTRTEVTFGGKRPSESLISSPEGEASGAERLNRLLLEYFEASKRAVDQRFGVLSLANFADNILMWSHYADNHTGICIEFDAAARPVPFPNTHAVVYRDESPVIQKRFANILMNLKDRGQQTDLGFLERLAKRDVEAEWTDREIRQWFLTKSTLWCHENEWRSIKPGIGTRKFPAASIAGVVLGCRADGQTEEMVRGWVKRRRRKIQLSRAVKREGAFALEIVPLD